MELAKSAEQESSGIHQTNCYQMSVNYPLTKMTGCGIILLQSRYLALRRDF